jgi:hypothetical protein
MKFFKNVSTFEICSFLTKWFGFLEKYDTVFSKFDFCLFRIM